MMIQNIADASGNQSTGIDQVNEAMSEIDKTSRENSANADEMSDSGTSIADVADNLHNRVDELRQLLGGGAARAGAFSPSRPDQKLLDYRR